MKQHIFSKNSWHYKLASLGSSRIEEEYRVDFCTYLRAMLKAIIGIAFMLLIGIFTVVVCVNCVSNLLAWVVYCIVNLDLSLPDPEAVVSLFFGVVALLYYFGKFVSQKITEYKRTHPLIQVYKKKGPSFLKVAYQKFKSKTCFYIDFE